MDIKIKIGYDPVLRNLTNCPILPSAGDYMTIDGKEHRVSTIDFVTVEEEDTDYIRLDYVLVNISSD